MLTLTKQVGITTTNITCLMLACLFNALPLVSHNEQRSYCCLCIRRTVKVRSVDSPKLWKLQPLTLGRVLGTYVVQATSGNGQCTRAVNREFERFQLMSVMGTGNLRKHINEIKQSVQFFPNGFRFAWC